MVAGPGGEMAGSGGRCHLRASDADREQVIGALKGAFVAGMLAKDEFDLRVGQALASRTYADLGALTADLPAGLAAARPLRPARATGEQPLLRPGQIAALATTLYAGVWVFAVLLPDVAGALLFLGSLVYFCVLAAARAVALENRRDKRSGGQLPRGHAPGADDKGFRRLPPAGPGGQLPPAGPGQQQSAEGAPIGRPRRPLLSGWRAQAATGYLAHPAWRRPAPAAASR